MGFMLAEKQNYEICEAIIEMFHEREISVEQSYAILDYVKRKIAQDTKVGELVKISYEDFLQLQKQLELQFHQHNRQKRLIHIELYFHYSKLYYAEHEKYSQNGTHY